MVSWATGCGTPVRPRPSTITQVRRDSSGRARPSHIRERLPAVTANPGTTPGCPRSAMATAPTRRRGEKVNVKPKPYSCDVYACFTAVGQSGRVTAILPSTTLHAGGNYGHNHGNPGSQPP